MDYYPEGDLYQFIMNRKENLLPEQDIKRMLANMVICINYLHSK